MLAGSGITKEEVSQNPQAVLEALEFQQKMEDAMKYSEEHPDPEPEPEKPTVPTASVPEKFKSAGTAPTQPQKDSQSEDERMAALRQKALTNPGMVSLAELC